MANKFQGAVDIHLGGANRTLKFDFNAICELEDYFGKPAHEIFAASGGFGLKEVRGTLWVGLLRFHKGITVEDVGDWMEQAANDGQFEMISEKLGEALGNALGGMSDDKEGEPPSGNVKPRKKTRGKKASTTPNSSSKPDTSG